MSNQCVPLPASDEQIKLALEQLAKLTNNGECQKSISSNSSSNASASTKTSNSNGSSFTIPFAASSASSQTTSSYTGCSSLFLKSKEIVEQANIINCSIKSSMTTFGASAIATAIVDMKTIGMDPNSATGIILTDTLNTLKEIKTKYNPTGNKLILINKMIDSIEVSFTPDINISGSTISIKASTGFNTNCKIPPDKATVICNAQKKIAELAALAVLENENANGDSNLSSLSEKTKTITNQKNIDIEETVNKVSVSASALGIISIVAVGSINLNNVVIDQDIHASLASNLLVSNAVQQGISAASELMTTNTQSSPMPKLVVSSPVVSTPVVSTPVVSTPVTITSLEEINFSKIINSLTLNDWIIIGGSLFVVCSVIVGLLLKRR